VDDFTSPSLIECQRQAILEPDRILVVSEIWREILAEEYGVRPVHLGCLRRRASGDLRVGAVVVVALRPVR
jgi:hypothetical protein